MSVQRNKNQVYLVGTITLDVAEEACSEILAAGAGPEAVVELHVTSPGGWMLAAERILDAVQTCPKPVWAYIRGEVGSAASLIVSYCSRRTMDRNATFMIHHARLPNGQVIEKEEDILFWMQRTGMCFELIQEFMVSERHLTAEEAFQFGFVDEVR